MGRTEETEDVASEYQGRIGAGIQFLAGVVLIAGIFAATVGALIVPINQLTQPGAEVTVSSDVTRAPELEQVVPSDIDLPRGAFLTDASDELTLVVRPLSWQLRLLSTASVAWAAIAILIACWMGFGLLRTIGEGHPFDRNNPGRLVVLAVLVAIGPMGASLLQNWAAEAVLAHLGIGGGNLAGAAPLDLAPATLALFVLALALAFKHGARLQDETAGLV